MVRLWVALAQQRLGDLFRKELEVDQPRIPTRLRRAGPLRTTQADALDGWIILAWRMESRGP